MEAPPVLPPPDRCLSQHAGQHKHEMKQSEVTMNANSKFEDAKTVIAPGKSTNGEDVIRKGEGRTTKKEEIEREQKKNKINEKYEAFSNGNTMKRDGTNKEKKRDLNEEAQVAMMN
jgi:hypothetical protein